MSEDPEAETKIIGLFQKLTGASCSYTYESKMVLDCQTPTKMNLR